MAEGYLKFYARQWAIIESAGVREAKIHPLTLRVMEEDSIDVSHHISKAVQKFDGQYFDYIITLCDEARDKLPTSIEYGQHLHFDIQDPAAAEGSVAEKLIVFRYVRESIRKRMLRLIGKRLMEGGMATVPWASIRHRPSTGPQRRRSYPPYRLCLES